MPPNDSTLAPDRELDGYQLVRFLGRGGFGEVWLCRSGATSSYHALKFIPAADPERLEKEHHALNLYRSAAAKLRSPHLVSIEHINRHDAGLFYIMPIADGTPAIDPADPAWQPLSLAAVIGARADAPAWFSSREIIHLMTPLLEALQALSDAGLVHRDVKPEIPLYRGTTSDEIEHGVCPHCSAALSIPYTGIVDTLPKLRSLLDGTLNTEPCPGCGVPITVQEPVMVNMESDTPGRAGGLKYVSRSKRLIGLGAA